MAAVALAGAGLRRVAMTLGARAIGTECTPRVVCDRRLDNERNPDTSTADMHSDTSEYKLVSS